MRVLFVTTRLPHLPCHDAARLAASHLVDHLAGRHVLAVVAATGGGDTPAQRGWLTSRAARVETVSGAPWRRAWSGRPADGLDALAATARRVAADFAPDVIHLEGAVLAPLTRAAGAPTVLACHESATLRARDVRRGGARGRICWWRAPGARPGSRARWGRCPASASPAAWGPPAPAWGARAST